MMMQIALIWYHSIWFIQKQCFVIVRKQWVIQMKRLFSSVFKHEGLAHISPAQILNQIKLDRLTGVWIYARVCSSSSLNKFPSRSIYDHLFHPDCQDSQAFFITSLEREPLVPQGLSTTTLFIRTVVQMWEKIKISRQCKEHSLTSGTWWNALLTGLSDWKWGWSWKRAQWLLTSLKCLICWFPRQCLLYTMQLAQFIFIQWTENSGSTFLFSVTESEKERLWKSAESVQVLKVTYWRKSA